MSETKEVFLRKASGLTRVVSPKDALMYAFVNPTIPYAYHYIIWSQVLYPGADQYLAATLIAALYPVVGLYALLSIAMPRSGGEYIFGSRILNPYIGLLASWGMVFGGGLMWSGSLASWGTMWGVGDTVYQLGLFYNNPAWQQLGLLLGNPRTGIAWIIGFVQLASAFFIMWLGTKWVMRSLWFVAVTTWIMLISFMFISFTTSNAQFVSRMADRGGLSYTSILDQARDVGWTPGLFSISATLMAGYTYHQLSTLGSTYVSNIAGEIKEIKKSMFLAHFGSLAMFIIYWELFIWGTYSGIGINMIQAISYLNAAGQDLAAFGMTFTPVVYHLTIYLTDNPILMLIAGPVGMFIINWGGILGLGFGPIRNLFAYAFDGILPRFVSAVDSKGHAWGSVLLGFVSAVLIHTVNTFTPWLAYIAHTIAVWFISWTILGIAGMLFHWRRKDIYERAPAVVKTRIAGIPVTFILGLLTAAFSAFSVYSILYPALTGTAVGLQLLYLGATIAFLMIVPTVIFWVAYFYRKSKGVPMDLRFREIPPD